MPTIPFFQVDAFTREPFRGNPAAVCPLHHWLPDAQLQAIAVENNLSETAFLVPRETPGHCDLRWFTPVSEVKLCGHATLASAAVLFASHTGDTLVFHTLSGPLTVKRDGDAYVMDFPAFLPQPTQAPPGLADIIGAEILEAEQSRDLLVRLADAETVRGLRPDFAALAKLDLYALIATAPGTGDDADVDFVSRFFAPGHGIPEDPVTGSAHCTLAPFWARRLGRTHLRARQVSPRTGEIECTLVGERVLLRGHAVKVIEGRMLLGG
jgi:PhzF family phenazine biosynthesis protein